MKLKLETAQEMGESVDALMDDIDSKKTSYGVDFDFEIHETVYSILHKAYNLIELSEYDLPEDNETIESLDYLQTLVQIDYYMSKLPYYYQIIDNVLQAESRTNATDII